jgi:hypothetical protein
MPCPASIEYEGFLSTTLIAFELNKNISGSTTQKLKVNTNPITFKSKKINYKWLKMMRINNGCNPPKSKHWPKICDWALKTTQKKIKFCGFSRKISVTTYLPTKCDWEVYTTHEMFESYDVYTMPSFNFDFKFTLGGSINLKSEFSIDSEGKAGAVGGLLLPATQEKINDLYGLTGVSDTTTPIGKMTSDKRIDFLVTMVKDNLAAGILVYLLHDTLNYSYTITSFTSTFNIEITTFKLSFGDLNITIPQFQISITIPDIIENHTITMKYNAEGTFTTQILLYSSKDKDDNFFTMMLNGITSTIDKYIDDPETNYDIKELQNIQKILMNKKDETTIWLEQYIGLTYELNVYAFFCISDAPETGPPPSPFSIKTAFTVGFNPYKILEKILDVTAELQSIMEKVENELLDDIKDIPGSFSHTLDSLMDSSLKQYNKVINKGLKAAQNDITKKYLNKELETSVELYIPVE